MKKLRFILLTLIIIACTTTRSNAQEASMDTLMKHVRMLSSSQFEGRLAGTQGYDNAARYVANVLSTYGVKPYYGEDWLANQFTVECNTIIHATFETYTPRTDERTIYSMGRDFVCSRVTGRGYADAQTVFCGYGIDNEAFAEYKKVDARGKIVMVLNDIPDFLPSGVTSRYASIRDKARTAKAHGALGLIVVNTNPQCPDYEVQLESDPGEGEHLTTFPIIVVNRNCVNQLFKHEQGSLDSLITELTYNHKPAPYTFRKRFTININTKYLADAPTANIVGIMPGSDRRMTRELLVVGANLDNVGQQGNTCIFGGADDNASSVAALLETARLLHNAPKAPGRSILFVVFSGSRQYNKGVEYFVEHFKESNWIDAFIGTESLGSGDSIILTGGARYPYIWNIAASNDSNYTHALLPNTKLMPDGICEPFHALGIPSLRLTTPNPNQRTMMPSDISEYVNYYTLAKGSTLMYRTLLQLSNGDYQGRNADSRQMLYNPSTKTRTPARR